MKKFQVVYFYKENGENFPVMVSETSSLTDSILNKKPLMKILDKSPKAKGNLYALVTGVEFKLDV